MNWLTERQEQAILIVWPWMAALFLMAFAIGLATIKSWRRLLIGLKSDGGRVPKMLDCQIFIIALIVLASMAWLLKLDLILVLLGVIGLMLILAGRYLPSLGWWPPSWRNLFWGMGMGAGCVFLFWILHSVIFVVWMGLKLPYEEQLAVKMFMETKNTPQIISIMLQACIMAPLLEELSFRGTFYPVLKSFLGGKIAVLISSMLFAWIHYYWVGFLPLMIFGVLVTLAYERTGSLWACVGIHAGFNFLNTLQLLIFKIGMDQVR
jgi:membrane protease YdiL (CAAX protease family)